MGLDGGRGHRGRLLEALVAAIRGRCGARCGDCGLGSTCEPLPWSPACALTTLLIWWWCTLVTHTLLTMCASHSSSVPFSLACLCPTFAPHSPPSLASTTPILDRRLTHRVCRSALLLGVGPTGSAPSGTHTRPAGRLLSCPFWQGGHTRGRGAASIPRSLWVCRAVSTGPLTQCLFVPPPAIGAPLI